MELRARFGVPLVLIVHTSEPRYTRGFVYLNTLSCYGYGFIVRVRDLRWSLMTGGGARFGVRDLCGCITEEHTLGLVSLNQVQRFYETMHGNKFVSSVNLQHRSGYDRAMVFHYRELSRTRLPYTMLMYLDVRVWDIMGWSVFWFALVFCLNVKIEMVRFVSLCVQCGVYESWTLVIVRIHILSLDICVTSTVLSSRIIYFGFYIVFWVSWFPIKIGECVSVSSPIKLWENLDLVRGWLRNWINSKIVWALLAFLPRHQKLNLVNKWAILLRCELCFLVSFVMGMIIRAMDCDGAQDFLYTLVFKCGYGVSKHCLDMGIRFFEIKSLIGIITPMLAGSMTIYIYENTKLEL